MPTRPAAASAPAAAAIRPNGCAGAGGPWPAASAARRTPAVRRAAGGQGGSTAAPARRPAPATPAGTAGPGSSRAAAAEQGAQRRIQRLVQVADRVGDASGLQPRLQRALGLVEAGQVVSTQR